MEKKIIEYWFPIESVGIEGKKEKQNAVGKIPSIHLYFARRPTCAARAIILSSLLKIPEDKDFNDYFNLIKSYGQRKIPKKIKFKEKNVPLLEALRKAFSEQNIELDKINAFDPFAGGGTFPLEIRQLGLNSYSSDLNPIAVLIEKATCDYPQRFGTKLIEELEKYYLQIEAIINKEMGTFYQNESNPKNDTKLFLWTRQIKCDECNIWIPLIKNFILSKKKMFALLPQIPENSIDNTIEFKIGWPSKSEKYFKAGNVICPYCGKTIPRKKVMKMVSENPNHRLLAIYEDVLVEDNKSNCVFRIPTIEEIENAAFEKEKIEFELLEKYLNLDLEFQEKIAASGIQNYGINSVFKCFNGRQLLLMKTIINSIIQIKRKIKNKYDDRDFFKAILLYLAFGLTRMADYNSNLTGLHNISSARIVHTFKRSTIFMRGLYVEPNPLIRKNSGGWMQYFDYLKKTLVNLIKQPPLSESLIEIKQMDAMELEYEDESMDFCFTDPPYYDKIPYASSMDFFYSWLRAILSDVFPELFLTPSTPKDSELIQDSFRHGGTKNGKKFYEEGMSKAFLEIQRILKKNGLAVVIFSHKEKDAWETLLQAIIDSALVITSTWPMLMEAVTGFRTSGVVSLDSVVLLVCRKSIKQEKRYFDENFRQDVEQKIKLKLDRQWRLGYRGSSFFLCAIGPSIEEFSKYESILDIKTDRPIKLNKFLEFIDQILVKFSLEKALGKEETSTDAETQLYLVWRASYKLAKLPYDEVWKFMHALGIDEKTIIDKIIKKVRVKSKTVYQCLDTISKKELFMNKNYKPSSLIDALQYAGFLWSENDSTLDIVMNQFSSKYGEEFWYVAQALINLVPDSPETKILIGLMRKYGKGLKIKIKSNGVKNKSKIIQKTFSIEGNNILLKKKDEKK